MHSCPHYQHPAPGGALVTTNGPIVTRHHYPESAVYMRAASWDWPFFGLGQMDVTCIHHYSITLGIFSALRSSVLHLVIPPSSLPACSPTWAVGLCLTSLFCPQPYLQSYSSVFQGSALFYIIIG